MNHATCYKCTAPKEGQFCPHCGHQHDTPRLNISFIISEFVSVINFEKGFFFTLKVLFLNPGENIRRFVLYDRTALVKPFVFLILCSLIFTLFQQLIGFEASFIQMSENEAKNQTEVMSWVTENYGYSNLVMALFCALWVKILFYRYQYHFFEILVLICYSFGGVMIMLTVSASLGFYIHDSLHSVGSVLSVFYTTWAIAQFFDKAKWYTYALGFSANLLGMFSFSAVALVFSHLLTSCK